MLALAAVMTLGACTGEPPDHSGGPQRGDEAAREGAGPPIDVAGHLAIAARTDLRPLRGVWHWGAVPIGITVGRDGAVYWAQYRTNTVERAGADGRNVETIATLDGPLGLAFGRADGELFYTTDRHYPRSIGELEPGGKPETLIAGMAVNRPFAITVGEKSGKLYWTESINGRIRSADADADDLATVYDDGIANVDEAADVVALSSVGIAVDEERGWIFWSDLRSATIVRARLDGSERKTILGREQGLDFPTAVAVDSSTGTLYWADPGTETIGRADLDGGHPEIVASGKDGVLEPWGLAVDGQRRFLYWTDVAGNAIDRIHLDRGQVERFVDLDAMEEATPAVTDATDPCSTAIAAARRGFLRRWLKLVRTCVMDVSATKAVMRAPTDLEACAGTCSRQLGMARDVGSLRSALASHCSASQTDAAIEETLGLGAEIVAADLPRSATFLRAVRPFVAAYGDARAPDTQEALAALDDLVERLKDVAAHSRPVGPPNARNLPATGQTTSYGAATKRAGTIAPVLDDGAVRAGVPLAYVDNGDGTISDPTTGLMWEKKCDGCGNLHDVDERYRWEPGEDETDVHAWLAAINAENGVGLAGHDDWRLPEIGELLSIVDFENFNPAVTAAFDGAGCGLGCSSLDAPECSCTNLGAYWTSGTAPRPDDVVPVVGLHLGAVWGQATDDDAYARAVRGPAAPRRDRFVDNDDGTVTDLFTGLMWEKKCLHPGDLHDVDRHLAWSFDGSEETVWDWVATINAEGGTGFAGHDDWRIPNVKELYSLFDETLSVPSIDRVFAGEGCADLLDPDCSLTADWPYWSSTTFADFPALALTVNYSEPGEVEDEPPPWVIRVVGGVEPHPKPVHMAVRAVRGPVDGPR